MIPIDRINNIKDYFSKIVLPQQLQLNDYTFIFDLPKCVDVLICRIEFSKHETLQNLYFENLIEIYTKLK